MNVEGYTRHWVENQSLSEAQRHANMADAAKRSEEQYQYQLPSKPPSQVWDRLSPLPEPSSPRLRLPAS